MYSLAILEVSDTEGDATVDADYTLELSLLESVGDIARGSCSCQGISANASEPE